MSRSLEDVLQAIRLHDEKITQNMKRMAENGEVMLKIVRWAVIGLIVLAGGEKVLPLFGA